jgi:hypothetical protein
MRTATVTHMLIVTPGITAGLRLTGLTSQLVRPSKTNMKHATKIMSVLSLNTVGMPPRVTARSTSQNAYLCFHNRLVQPLAGTLMIL